MEENAFEELVNGIEEQMNSERLQKQGAHAVTAAKISGLVFTEAVATGVPAALAQEMATDTWNSVMGFHPLLTDGPEDVEAVG
ncbi:hypothetical protein [Streptomyces sp. NPDC051546]|uniref:hypothetical protein n=1 Tax=Streptomyces sp. NPDC051546 TaxID=3365655 RepID=UPI0037B92056